MARPKKSETKKSQKSVTFETVKGMADILPKDQDWWRMISQVGQNVSDLHDFHFIETPILESAGLFESGIGAATDIVENQMFGFRTKSNDRLALRPESTLPIMRSYLEHNLGYFSFPLKVYHYGPIFRRRKLQAGERPQFHQ